MEKIGWDDLIAENEARRAELGLVDIDPEEAMQKAQERKAFKLKRLAELVEAGIDVSKVDYKERRRLIWGDTRIHPDTGATLRRDIRPFPVGDQMVDVPG
ncbi:hypothetical protein JQK15_13475 [Sphingobium sp. BHU LFT2]|uniref:hypothetical protein n=1 Tax=Sphingobium sp. BHU LFT2 TaxID=2807634 RepID=UPI001BE83701|nr:hypothetical protein [Sphingobium sp. BHU LFT2]MBT2244549.1 hypothetical protein [Sphingobium sp. BHU LFT2]